MDHQSIYIASAEPHAGSLVVAIGFMELFKGQYEKVGFFRPIIPDGDEREPDIEFMIKHFELSQTYGECCGFTVSEYIEAYSNNREDRLHEALMHKLGILHKKYEFIVIEGYPRHVFSSVFEFDINLEIAKNLDTGFVPIINAKEKNCNNIISEIQLTSEMVQEEGCTLLSTFVNRCDERLNDTIQERINKLNLENPVYVFPEVKELDTPTLGQVIKTINAKMLLGDESQLQHLVYGNKIAAMGVENYLNRIETGDIVIVPGDRVDIVLVTLLSFFAKEHPNVTAIIVSGDIPISETIMGLIKDFPDISIPLFFVKNNSYETAIALEKTQAHIDPESKRKITIAKGLFDSYVDINKLRDRFIQSEESIITPLMFEYRIFEQAREERQKIVLPEAEDDRILRAADTLIHRDIVDIVLLGDPQEITQRAIKMDLDISRAEIINPNESELKENFSELFYEMRKEKGLTPKVARDAMDHVSYFATMMVHTGIADGMVSGAIHTTADTIRPALQIIKTKDKSSVVSSVFFMCLDTKVLVYGDCAINMDPDAKTLAQIAVSSADTAKEFGIEPKVALLSYSTGTSGFGPEVEKVREATKIAQGLRPEILIEGPIQYDAAIDVKVAKTKLSESKVAGHASVFIFPNLNTGNNTYKAVQQSTGALAIGPILQGLRLPINDLSRGCTVDDIVNTVAITAIQAQGVKK